MKVKMSHKLNTQFKSAEASPGFLFWKIANLHQKLQRQVLSDLNISPTQFSILACYFFCQNKPGLPTQSDICEMAGLDKMLVSDITKTLLAKQLIRKKSRASDKRSYEIELSEEGKIICNKAIKLIET